MCIVWIGLWWALIAARMICSEVKKQSNAKKKKKNGVRLRRDGWAYWSLQSARLSVWETKKENIATVCIRLLHWKVEACDCVTDKCLTLISYWKQTRCRKRKKVSRVSKGVLLLQQFPSVSTWGSGSDGERELCYEQCGNWFTYHLLTLSMASKWLASAEC